MKGRYLRALTDKPESARGEAGDYWLIGERRSIKNVTTGDSLAFSYSEGRVKGPGAHQPCWELMPEGFRPSRVEWKVGDELEFVYEVTDHYDKHGNRMGYVEEKGSSFKVARISTTHPDLFQFKGDEETDTWYMNDGFILREKKPKPAAKANKNSWIEIGGYVRITEAGSYGGADYHPGEVWKVYNLSSLVGYQDSGIFVSRQGFKTQLGFKECEWIGMSINATDLRAHVDNSSTHDFSIISQSKSDEHVRSNKSVQLRTKSPQIGQGEGCLEGRIQGRESKAKLAVCDPLNEGSISYGKAKGGRP